MKGQKAGDEAQEDVFKTFIVRFIGNQDYSFYNVETPWDGLNHDRLDDRIGFDIDSSASPQSFAKNPQSAYSQSDYDFSMNSDSLGSSKMQSINKGST